MLNPDPTVGTWYPPSAGTGGMLAEAQLLINPPFATQPMTPTPITVHQVRQQDGDVLWRVCLGSTCRETPDLWQARIWAEQFQRLRDGEPEGDGG